MFRLTTPSCASSPASATPTSPRLHRTSLPRVPSPAHSSAIRATTADTGASTSSLDTCTHRGMWSLTSRCSRSAVRLQCHPFHLRRMTTTIRRRPCLLFSLPLRGARRSRDLHRRRGRRDRRDLHQHHVRTASRFNHPSPLRARKCTPRSLRRPRPPLRAHPACPVILHRTRLPLAQQRAPRLHPPPCRRPRCMRRPRLHLPRLQPDHQPRIRQGPISSTRTHARPHSLLKTCSHATA